MVNPVKSNEQDGIFKTTFRLPGLGGPVNVEASVARNKEVFCFVVGNVG